MPSFISKKKNEKKAEVLKLRATGLSLDAISESMLIDVEAVTRYWEEIIEEQRDLAANMDAGKLAVKKADLVTSLEFDLSIAYEQLDRMKKGTVVSLAKGDLPEVVKYNDTAIVSCLRLIADVRTRLATMYGLDKQEAPTGGGGPTAIININSKIPPPSAIIEAEVVDDKKGIDGDTSS